MQFLARALAQLHAKGDQVLSLYGNTAFHTKLALANGDAFARELNGCAPRQSDLVTPLALS